MCMKKFKTTMQISTKQLVNKRETFKTNKTF